MVLMQRTNMLCIFNTAAHFRWIVGAWKFVFGASQGTSASVIDLLKFG